MNDHTVNNWAMGLAVFSFGFLSIGSVLFEATVITAVLRGIGGGILFGTLIWLMGSMIVKEDHSIDAIALKRKTCRIWNQLLPKLNQRNN